MFVAWIVISFGSAVIAALAAGARNRSPLGWFALGLLFGVFAVGAVLVMRPVEAPRVGGGVRVARARPVHAPSARSVVPGGVATVYLPLAPGAVDAAGLAAVRLLPRSDGRSVAVEAGRRTVAELDGQDALRLRRALLDGGYGLQGVEVAAWVEDGPAGRRLALDLPERIEFTGPVD